MGGAPFNVAWHLAGLGAKPLHTSRIGHDPCGDAVLAGMRDWGMDVSGIQMDTQAPTGQVQIALTGTDHSFTILPDQAYDRIATEQPWLRSHRLTQHFSIAAALSPATPSRTTR
jgi:fructokinase